jgi:hypothetical protein
VNGGLVWRFTPDIPILALISASETLTIETMAATVLRSTTACSALRSMP